MLLSKGVKDRWNLGVSGRTGPAGDLPLVSPKRRAACTGPVAGTNRGGTSNGTCPPAARNPLDGFGRRGRLGGRGGPLAFATGVERRSVHERRRTRLSCPPSCVCLSERPHRRSRRGTSPSSPGGRKIGRASCRERV